MIFPFYNGMRGTVDQPHGVGIIHPMWGENWGNLGLGNGGRVV